MASSAMAMAAEVGATAMVVAGEGTTVAAEARVVELAVSKVGAGRVVGGWEVETQRSPMPRSLLAAAKGMLPR